MKLNRELLRIVQQIGDLPQAIGNYLFANLYQDLWLSRQRRVLLGQRPEAKKVAIFVIYPKHGLLESHLIALRYLGQRGYAPLVVSNGALSERDERSVLSLAWMYVERKNFGYDFGAYRDGVLVIAERIKGLSHLAMMNDSCWFPVPGASDWLETAEGLSKDFCGVTSHYGFARPGMRPISVRWLDHYSSASRKFHYGSFAILIGQRVLREDGFVEFWRNLRISNSKKRTVKRGEVGLTQWILRQGYSHADTAGMGQMAKVIEGLGVDDARASVDHLFSMRHDLLAGAQIPSLELEAMRNKLALAAVADPPIYALWYLMIEVLGQPFLKKLISEDAKFRDYVSRKAADGVAFWQAVQAETGHGLQEEHLIP